MTRSGTSVNRLVRRAVASERNSSCGSARLADLDWSTWWTDNSFGSHYLHVQHKDGETVHRVYCRACECPRLEMRRGKLMWIYTPNDQVDGRGIPRPVERLVVPDPEPPVAPKKS